jgi:ribosomal protein S18 acetylase RimI-like enzyme
MMGHTVADKANSGPQVVDLCTLAAAELDELWRHEVGAWRDRLLWDISAAAAAFRRIMGRGGVPGKAVRIEGRVVGFAYCTVVGHLGVIAGLVMPPGWGAMAAGEVLLRETVDALRSTGVERIEAPLLSFDHPWLTAAFERLGFRTCWREFLRVALHDMPAPMPPPAAVELAPWRGARLDEVAQILHAAYDGGIDAEIHQRYRTADGCRVVLDDVLNQGVCGSPVAEASALAYHRGRGVGFVLTTEIAPGQGHVAQVAVLPAYQRQGIGRSLLDHTLARLAERQFDTLSLIVSQANNAALRLYHALGFHPVLTFPVFTWER